MRRVSLATLEYSIVQHCNLSCCGCDHGSPMLPRHFVSVDEFRGALRAARDTLQVGVLLLLGGEPLLHPELEQLIDCARTSGVAGGVGLVTNGVLLHALSPRVWAMLTRLDLSLYPGVRLRMPLERVVELAEQHHVQLVVRKPHAFRATLLKERVADDQLVQRVFDSCRIAHDYRCRSLARGRFYTCSVAPQMPAWLTMLGVDTAEVVRDGVPLQAGVNSCTDVERSLRTAAPLASCRFCLGTAGVDITHHQDNAADRAAWLMSRDAGPMAQINPDRLKPIRSPGESAEQGIPRSPWTWVAGALLRLRRDLGVSSE